MPTAQDTAVAVRREGLDLITHELELREKALLEVLPPGLDAKRFMRVSLMAVAKNPDLLTCTPQSIIASIIEAAEIGLEPTGSLNRAWLVPFKEKDGPKKAQLMIGYQGYADLMRDGDSRRRVVAEVVYEGDYFKVIKGSEQPRIEHEPKFATEDPIKITYAYAIVFYPDGTNQFEVMTRQQVELVRAKSKQKNGPAWTEGYGQMSRKSALRRLSNYTPLSARAIAAIARDDEREFGVANNTPVEAMAPAGGTRTAQAREAVKARRRGAQPEEAATPDAAPEKSAGEQADAATETTDGLCGASSDPKLGDVEACVLPAGHEGPDGKPTAHESKAGTKFPNKP